MSKRSQEKRKARAKEKAAQLRRQRHGGPLSQLVGGAEGRGVECWMHAGSEGLISVFAFRGTHGAGTMAGVFLIDELCLGVKDAYILREVMRHEMIESMRQGLGDAGDLRQVSAEEARALVAGAVRWTKVEDFRIPEGTANALKVLGGEMDFENANVSRFGTEDGGLCYIGREADLARALKEETVEEFLEREDVECEFTDEAWDVLDETEGDFGEGESYELGEERGGSFGDLMGVFRLAKEDLVKRVTAYRADVGKEVPEMLPEAALYRMSAMLECINEGIEGGKARVEGIAARLMSQVADGEIRASIGEAYEAILEFFAAQPEDSDPLQAMVTRMQGIARGQSKDVVGEAVERLSERMYAAARRWCFATAQAPHSELKEAIELYLSVAGEEVRANDFTSEEALRATTVAMEERLMLEGPERREKLMEAFEQLRGFMKSFETAEAMERALEMSLGG